jgi:Protein of unknown function (DUF4089)
MGALGDPDLAFDPDRHIDALAPTMGLSISDTERAGVIQFLTVAHTMATRVFAAPLDNDAMHLAPVFRPGTPNEGYP